MGSEILAGNLVILGLKYNRWSELAPAHKSNFGAFFLEMAFYATFHIGISVSDKPGKESSGSLQSLTLFLFLLEVATSTLSKENTPYPYIDKSLICSLQFKPLYLPPLIEFAKFLLYKT